MLSAEILNPLIICDRAEPSSIGMAFPPMYSAMLMLSRAISPRILIKDLTSNPRFDVRDLASGLMNEQLVFGLFRFGKRNRKERKDFREGETALAI